MSFQSFTSLFDKIVERYPDHTAIMTDGIKKLSYKNLQARALSIAARLPLADRGSIICLALPKSADYIASLLACWYRGYAFLPIDPGMPSSRVEYILKDAAPAAILATGKNYGGFVTINIRDIHDGTIATAALDEKDTAYVIYTSGSTGAPKGVMVSHAGLTPVLLAQIKLFNLNSQSRSLFYLSTSFDASISDIGTALLSGACLCIETTSKISTAANLAEIIHNREITYMDIPPALLRLMDPEKMPLSLDTLTIGGEVCPPAVVRQWARHFRIVNVYGPTEATICTSAVICGAEGWDTPLIGDPLPGVDYFIFDKNGQAADDGELYIGGAHLALGYLKQPGLTSAKFITKDGRRLYKTGDHVIRHASGIEFIGRIDRQIKWRGQLIELEEIEKTILLHPEIARAAALKTSVNGQETLAAFVERKDKSSGISSAEIRALLARHLPGWMLPQSFTIMDRLPLTVTGKINLNALAQFPVDDSHDNTAPFTPASPDEEKLLQCWKRVLKRDSIPAHKSFLALGGDSFAVLQLMLEAEMAGINMTPDFIHHYPTLSSQARQIFSTQDIRADKKDAKELRQALDRKMQDIGGINYPPPHRDTQDIFMIGATGFLGGRMLMYLLQHTKADLHLLIRAGNNDVAWERLKLSSDWKNRIHLYCGDASLPQFGLSDDDWNGLCHKIDTIVNSAALVNMLLPYESLYDANTGSVENIISLALNGKRKKLHHASTLSVFVSTDQNHGRAMETDELENTNEIYGGYSQTKWAAEYLLNKVKSLIDISIYRFGLVTPDSMTGEASSHDFLKVFMKGLISLGHAPAGPHDKIFVDVTPIDYAETMFGRLILKNKNDTYHIANEAGFSLAQIINRLRAHGHDIKTLSQDEWDSFIQQKKQQKPLTPIESVSIMAMCRCLPTQMFEIYRAIDLFQATDTTFDMFHVKRDLGDDYLAPPKPDDTLLDLYIKSL